jgi:hypothetical protein
MLSKRQAVDYALQRRSTLEGLRGRNRRVFLTDACDADPLLTRAAFHHGEASQIDCPVANCGKLVNLNYVFGDQLGQYSGRIKSTAELEEMQNEVGEFKVCVVEVCLTCGWNHMIASYVLGDGRVRPKPRRQKTVEDIYG